MKADVVPSELSAAPNVAHSQHYEVHQGIADQMEALAIELRSISNSTIDRVPTEATLLAVSGKIYSARRKIDDIFNMAGFSASPGWDMMLDLYRARAQGKAVSVTSACIGGACAATTGLRWLQALEGMQLIERAPDANDKRRIVVSLTEGGKVKVDTALAAYL
jgi:hypothetical protein